MLTWTGPVYTTEPFTTSGPNPAKGQHHTFATKAGNLAIVVSAKPVNTQKLVDPAKCEFAFGTTVPYTVVGSQSTGKFAGATGSGSVNVTFSADLPKLKSGKCNESNNVQPIPSSSVAVSTGGGPLTIKR